MFRQRCHQKSTGPYRSWAVLLTISNSLILILIWSGQSGLASLYNNNKRFYCDFASSTHNLMNYNMWGGRVYMYSGWDTLKQKIKQGQCKGLAWILVLLVSCCLVCFNLVWFRLAWILFARYNLVRFGLVWLRFIQYKRIKKNMMTC